METIFTLPASNRTSSQQEWGMILRRIDAAIVVIIFALALSVSAPAGGRMELYSHGNLRPSSSGCEKQLPINGTQALGRDIQTGKICPQQPFEADSKSDTLPPRFGLARLRMVRSSPKSTARGCSFQ
jgi:hypothetical protein